MRMKRGLVLSLILGLFLIGSISAWAGPSWSVDITRLNDQAIQDYYSSDVNRMSFLISGIDCNNVTNVWYILNGNLYSFSGACSSSEIVLTSLIDREGNNTWEIYVNDSSGIVESDSVDFWVDSITPVLSVINPTTNQGFTNGNPLTLIANLNEVNKGEYDTNKYIYRRFIYPNLLGEENYFSLSSNLSDCSLTPSEPQEGNYTYIIKAKDIFPNGTIIREVTTSGVITRDVTDPSVSINSPSNNSNLNETFAVETSASDSLSGVNSINISLYDTGNIIQDSYTCSNQDSCTWNLNSTLLVDGAYYLIATAIDKANNDASTSPLTINVDNTNPNITFVSPASRIYNSAQLVNITASDVHLSLIKLYVNGENVINSSNTERTYLLGEGEYLVYAIALDSFGNSNQTGTRNIIIDYTSPIVTLTGDNPQIIELGVSYSELGANATDNIDGDISANLTIDSSGVNTNVVGSYFVSYYSEDRAKNNNTQIRNISVVDTTAPEINLISPVNKKGFEFDSEIFVEFNSSDLSVIANCTILRDGITNETFNLIDQTVNHNTTWNLDAGKYNWTVQCTDVLNNIALSETREFTILANTTFSDATTNFTDLTNEADISNVIYFFISSQYGKINWTTSIDFSSGIDWASCISISQNRVEVNSSCFSGFNVSVRITMNNLTWTSPQILKDGEVCNSCVLNSYNSGTLVFTVNGFSVYTTQETPVVSGGSSGGSSSSCTDTWSCSDWSECSNDLQTRTCTKTNSCSRETNKPTESQSCTTEEVESELLEEEIVDEEVSEQGFLSRITGAITGATIGNTGGRTVIWIIGTVVVLAWAYFGIRYLKNRKINV